MTYSDPIRSASTTAETVATITDGLLTSYAQQELPAAPGVINTASTSYVDWTGSSISINVAAGEIVEIAAQIDLSSNAAGQRVNITISEDGVDLGKEAGFVTYRSDTGGQDTTIMIHLLRAPSVGAHTYKIRWKTSAGIAYSKQSRLIAKAWQNT